MKSRMTMHVFLGMMGLFLAPGLVVGQTVSGSVGRTPYGHPDFQGLWTNSTTTPLERPDRVADQAVYSDEEVAAIDAANGGRNDRLPPSGDPGTYNDFWWERGTALTRTSLVVDPPEGRLPERTMAGDVRARWSRGVDSWTERSLAERCVTRGAPKRPGGYNNNFLVLQTEDYVVMLQEMIHEPRIIPLDGRPPVDERIRLWMGDSRGRWEGDTLVVETKNFHRLTSVRGSTPEARLIERFTRVGLGAIRYEFTVEDVETWARPWTAQVELLRTDEPLYEYACHEGNYSMAGILAGARAEEAARAAK